MNGDNKSRKATLIAFETFMRHGPQELEHILEPWDYWHLLKWPRKRRKPTSASIIKKAKALGVDVTVAADGAMTLRTSQQRDDVTKNGNGASNPWDEVLANGRAH